MPKETKSQAEQTVEDLDVVVGLLEKIVAITEANPQAKAADLMASMAEPDHPVQVMVELMGPDSNDDEDPKPVSLFKAVGAAAVLMAKILKDRREPDEKNPDPSPDQTDALFHLLTIGCHTALTNAVAVMECHRDDSNTPEDHKDLLRDTLKTLEAGCPFLDPRTVRDCVCKVTTPKQDPSQN